MYLVFTLILANFKRETVEISKNSWVGHNIYIFEKSPGVCWDYINFMSPHKKKTRKLTTIIVLEMSLRNCFLPNGIFLRGMLLKTALAWNRFFCSCNGKVRIFTVFDNSRMVHGYDWLQKELPTLRELISYSIGNEITERQRFRV